MKRIEGTWLTATWVSMALVFALTAAGFASTAYKRERRHLGESHFKAGEALAAANQDEGAVEQYRKALLFDTDNTKYRLSLATALLRDHRLDEAQSYLQQLQDEDPNNPLVYVALAQIALERKQVSRGIQEYQHAVYQYWPAEMVPVRRDTRWKLVKLLNDNGRRTESTGELLQLYASSPPDPVEKDKIGFALLQNGALSEASRVFGDVIRQYPHDAAAERGLARAQFARSSYVEARHSFQRALRADPHDAESQRGLALTNAVIEIDGSLERISESERIRRDENLLRRVLSDVAKCSGPESQLATDIDAAQKLLVAKRHSGEDVGFELVQAAQQLWTERAAACGPDVPGDPAVEQILTSGGDE